MQNLQYAIIEILKKRGISTADDVVEFLSYKPRISYDPFLMKGMDEAVDKILNAIDMGLNICIYGDYDADGVTSIALLKGVLSSLGMDASYYIPSRFDEGYGLNKSALDAIKDAGADLVITVDCGITSIKEVSHAQEIGLDIIVTDHHEPGPALPSCIAIDPMRDDCAYPFKRLAGVGVSFKLAQALCSATGLGSEVLTRNLDLVAIGTVADIVPLVDENRTLVKYGLRVLNITERPGLGVLLKSVDLEKGKIKSQDISFIIGPYLNSAGRMGDASVAARLLLTENSSRAGELVEKIKEYNERRRTEQARVITLCGEALKLAGRIPPFIVITLEDAGEGVIGIAAGKVKEIYKRPTMILTDEGDGTYKGSARSTAKIDIFALLNKGRALYEHFGGHKAACGLTIKKDKLNELKSLIAKEMELLLKEDPDILRDEPKPEIIMRASDVNHRFLKEQELLEPFGKDNEYPLIGIEGYPADIGYMGNKNQYMNFNLKLRDGRNIRAVDFQVKKEHKEKLIQAERMGKSVLTVGFIEENRWNNRSYIQLNIRAVDEGK
jgi:single-stranded-DNA-specific exonuclease